MTTVLALSGAVDAGFSGVAILSSQSLVMGVYWLSRFWGSLEQDFNSVERAQEYLVLPQEPPSIIEGHRPPAYWPSNSNKEFPFLQVNNLTIRYAPDLPAVLQDLTFSIKAKEKIGVVGRTGRSAFERRAPSNLINKVLRMRGKARVNRRWPCRCSDS